MEDIKKILSEKYKTSSIKTYSNNLVMIFKSMDYTLTDEPLIKKFPLHKFFESIKDLKKTTQRNYISSLIALLKCRDETNDNFYNALSEQRDFLNSFYINQSESGSKSDSEKKNWVSADELKGAYETHIEKTLRHYGMLTIKGKKYKAKDLNESQQEEIRTAVILAFYYKPFQDIKNNTTGILRNDLVTLHYARGKLPDDKKNYFWMKASGKPFIILRDYKTDRTHGVSEVALDKEMGIILNNYRLVFNIVNGDKLFDMTKHGLTNLLIKASKKYFGKSVGTQALRKIYLTEKFGKVKKEQKEVSANMLHTQSIQNNIYIKTE